MCAPPPPTPLPLLVRPSHTPPPLSHPRVTPHRADVTAARPRRRRPRQPPLPLLASSPQRCPQPGCARRPAEQPCPASGTSCTALGTADGRGSPLARLHGGGGAPPPGGGGPARGGGGVGGGCVGMRTEGAGVGRVGSKGCTAKRAERQRPKPHALSRGERNAAGGRQRRGGGSVLGRTCLPLEQAPRSRPLHLASLWVQHCTQRRHVPALARRVRVKRDGLPPVGRGQRAGGRGRVWGEAGVRTMQDWGTRMHNGQAPRLGRGRLHALCAKATDLRMGTTTSSTTTRASNLAASGTGKSGWHSTEPACSIGAAATRRGGERRRPRRGLACVATTPGEQGRPPA